MGGIFSADGNSTVSSRTKVLVPQCSGDAWLGASGGLTGKSKLFNKWYFRGAAIYRSVIKHLVKEQGLGSHPGGEQIIFGGVDSGARGAMHHIDGFK